MLLNPKYQTELGETVYNLSKIMKRGSDVHFQTGTKKIKKEAASVERLP